MMGLKLRAGLRGLQESLKKKLESKMRERERGIERTFLYPGEHSKCFPALVGASPGPKSWQQGNLIQLIRLSREGDRDPSSAVLVLPSRACLSSELEAGAGAAY